MSDRNAPSAAIRIYESEAVKKTEPKKKERRRPKPDIANAITLSVEDSCSISGLSRSFLYDLMVRQQLEFRKAGTRRLIVAESLRRYLANLPTA